VSDECKACEWKGDMDARQRGWHSCGRFVGCDDDCRAIPNPTTAEEVAKALDHWENHSYLNGCAHGS
jgi:hypothetical protein